MKRKRVNMALDISFTIETDNDFEDVTQEEVYIGLLGRMKSLLENWEPEAVGFIDEYELEE